MFETFNAHKEKIKKTYKNLSRETASLKKYPIHDRTLTQSSIILLYLCVSNKAI